MRLALILGFWASSGYWLAVAIRDESLGSLICFAGFAALAAAAHFYQDPEVWFVCESCVETGSFKPISMHSTKLQALEAVTSDAQFVGPLRRGDTLGESWPGASWPKEVQRKRWHESEKWYLVLADDKTYSRAVIGIFSDWEGAFRASQGLHSAVIGVIDPDHTYWPDPWAGEWILPEGSPLVPVDIDIFKDCIEADEEDDDDDE